MDVKKRIQEKKVKQWQLAEVLGVSEFTLSRWLRRPENMDTDRKNKIEVAIKKLAEKE